MKNLECSNCVVASSQNSNSFLERFDRMNPWRRRRNFKPMKLKNSLVGTKAFIKDSLRQCARLVKAFGTKLRNSNCRPANFEQIERAGVWPESPGRVAHWIITLDHFFYALHIRHNFPYKLIPTSMS